MGWLERRSSAQTRPPGRRHCNRSPPEYRGTLPLHGLNDYTALRVLIEDDEDQDENENSDNQN